jgi:anti-sigma B factor antagonist
VTAETWDDASRHTVTRPTHVGSDPANGGDASADQVIDVTVERPGPHVVVVKVSGEVDMLTTPILRSTVDQEVAGGCRTLVVDLRGVTFLGSSGLAALVETHRVAEASGVALKLVGTSRAVTRPLVATGLREVFELHEDVDSAATS